jgi:4-amino-4-deoxy-L-arabinose transferase-like glycosyltransferase
MSAVRKSSRLSKEDEEEVSATEAPESAPIFARILGELFGDDLSSTKLFQWFRSFPIERRQLALVVLGASAMILPMLGAVGLWDPWETHFAEVGRVMMAKHDWVHPWWQHAPFYSKPPLTMWLTNIGLWLSGAGSTVRNQEMGIWADWGVRLPIGLMAIATIGMLYLAASRIFDRRIGLLAATACVTMPLYAILARQAITDTPFVCLLTSGMCCFAIAEFDPNVKHRDPWLFAFYGLIGLSTLAKEIPFGFGIPGAVVLVYLLLTWDWALLKRVRLVYGGILALLIAAPWVVVMMFDPRLEEENETFRQRYWIHDNFQRLLGGVHTTSPDAHFTYYIEQLGYATYPWAVFLPGALATLGIDPRLKANRAKVFVGLWALIPFLVVSLSATKFEHYAFPCLPPLAILIAFYMDRLWRDGLRAHTFSLIVGAGLYAMIGKDYFAKPKLITEMFTYNPERPYPNNLIADPMPVIAALIVVGVVVAAIGFLRGGKTKAILAGAGLLLFGFGLYVYVHMGPTGWVNEVMVRWAPRDVMGGMFLFFGLLGTWAVIAGRREWFLAAATSCAIAFAGYLSWVHWEQLSPHWTQREIFHTYYTERLPGETVVAYLMNWKGETFYTKNEIRQAQDPKKLAEFLQEPSGPQNRHWVITDTRYYKAFQQLMASQGKRVTMKDDSSVKFYLVTVE